MLSATHGDQSLQSQATARLEELRRQLQIGQSELAAKERELMGLKDTVLRIAGAIQVLEELLEAPTDHVNGRSPEAAGADQGSLATQG